MKTCIIALLVAGVFASELFQSSPVGVEEFSFESSKKDISQLEISKSEDYAKFAGILLKSDYPSQWADLCLDCDVGNLITVDFEYATIENKTNDFEEKIVSFILNGKELSQAHLDYISVLTNVSKLRLADEILSNSNAKYTREYVINSFSLASSEDMLHLNVSKAREFGLHFIYKELASRVDVYNFAIYYCRHFSSIEDIIPFSEELTKLPFAKKSKLLYGAVNTYHFNFATLLIKDLKFSLPIVGKSRKTLLHIVNPYVRPDFLKLLLNDPRYLASTDINGRSFLFSWINSEFPIEHFKFAFENIDQSVLHILVNQRDRFGTSLLSFVLIHKRHDLLLMFLRNGASVDVQVPVRIPEFNASKILKDISHWVPLGESQIPRPPLDYAIYNRDYEAAIILLNESIGHFDQTNALNQNVMDVALQTKDDKLIAAISAATEK